MTLIWPFKVTQGQTDYAIGFTTYHFLYVFYSNYSAISHGIYVFSRWPWSGLSRSLKVKLNTPFYSRHIISHTCSLVNYSAISHRNPAFQQMTLIWSFKVTEGQSDHAIRFASHDFLYVFHSNLIGSHGSRIVWSNQIDLWWPWKIRSRSTAENRVSVRDSGKFTIKRV